MEKCIGSLGSQQPVELKDKRRRRRRRRRRRKKRRRGGMKPACDILFYKVNSVAIYDADFLAVS
jgi:hypothetical protein